MSSPLKTKLKSTINRIFKGEIPYVKDFTPLYNKEKKLMLSLSGKSGSVYAIKWFFFHSPFWHEAKNYPKWIHKYRQEVFHESKKNHAARLDFWQNPSSYTKIKLVRNPYSRAVSSYAHVLRYPKTLEKDIKAPLDKEGLSFTEFISWIETINIKTCNLHYSTQVHCFERLAEWNYDYLIKLESSGEGFAKLEKDFGLPSSPFEELRKSKHHSNHHQGAGFVGDERIPFGRSAPSKYPYFYNHELVERVRLLYAEDFERYGYSTEFEPPHL